MKASDWTVDFLQQQGVRVVFEVAGGMIAHLLDSLAQQSAIRVVSMHHEQAAAFAAEGLARMTGRPGVALATSGPGATNLLTGIGSLYFDSYPAVFITGQVNRNELKGQKAVRQLGFQELDIVSMARPITKEAWTVHSSEELPADLAKAFSIATHGRPGPVLLDIPMDVQREALPLRRDTTAHQTDADLVADPEDAARMIEAFTRAERPLVLAGGGLRSAQVVEKFRELIEILGVPTVHSLQAVDVLEYDNPLRVGMIGSYGNRWANYALARSDFLLVLGSRLDVRQTGAQTDAFKGNRTIVHVDCEPGEINSRVVGCEPILAELGNFINVLSDQIIARNLRDHSGWIQEIETQRGIWPDTAELADLPGINPNRFVHQLSAASKSSAAWVVDVGQHQMWAAQSVELGPDQRFLSCGGMGAMGFALPAAIGAALATEKPIICFSGDGGFQMNVQELETVNRLNLPLKLVVIDNGSLGMVRQFQTENFASRYQSTVWGYGRPDFCRVADAYGLATAHVERASDVDDAIAWLWSDPMAPALLRVSIDPSANAYPKMSFGEPLDQMHPRRTRTGG